MIIPGTGIKPDAPQLEQASKMGLWIAQHHAEPLGAEMFSNAYPGIIPRYPEDFDKFVKDWAEVEFGCLCCVCFPGTKRGRRAGRSLT